MTFHTIINISAMWEVENKPIRPDLKNMFQESHGVKPLCYLFRNPPILKIGSKSRENYWYSKSEQEPRGKETRCRIQFTGCDTTKRGSNGKHVVLLGLVVLPFPWVLGREDGLSSYSSSQIIHQTTRIRWVGNLNLFCTEAKLFPNLN